MPKATDVNLIMRFLTILPLNRTSPITLSKKNINTFYKYKIQLQEISRTRSEDCLICLNQNNG